MNRLTAGEDYQADIGRCIGFDVIEVNLHELIALLDLLALFNEGFKALTAQFYRIHAEVNQEFRTVSSLHANGDGNAVRHITIDLDGVAESVAEIKNLPDTMVIGVSFHYASFKAGDIP